MEALPPSSQRYTDHSHGYPSAGSPFTSGSGISSSSSGASRGSHRNSSSACPSAASIQGSPAGLSRPTRGQAGRLVVTEAVHGVVGAVRAYESNRQIGPLGELSREQAPDEVGAGLDLVRMHLPGSHVVAPRAVPLPAQANQRARRVAANV